MDVQQKSDQTVTLQHIADRCGLSKSTVGLALREKPCHLAASTIAFVRSVAQEMGYDPSYHETARRLALRKQGGTILNKMVGVIFPGDFMKMPFYTETFHGLSEVLEAADFLTCIGHLAENSEDNSSLGAFHRIISRGEIDGIITTGGQIGFGTVYEELRRNRGFLKRPIVTIFESQPDCASVRANVADGTYQAACHLLDLGHTDILQTYYFHDEEGLQPIARIQAVRRAMTERGLDPDTHHHPMLFVPTWVDPLSAHHDISDFNATDGGETEPSPLIEYLRAHPQVSAVLALNDAEALHAWYDLHRAGYRVPDDISLIGCDDTDPMRDAQGVNLLTTIRLPLVEMGREAARLMLRCIAGETPCDTRIELPTQLIIRASTASRK